MSDDSLYRIGPDDWERFRVIRLASLQDAPEAVVAWANDQSVRTLELDVREQNVPARRLYARCGFVDCGRSDDDPPERRMVRNIALRD